METVEQLQREYDDLHAQATRLAGGLTDLAQRATVYYHLFEASGRNHIFPLIAAHGALWARGYFSFGMKLGAALAWQFPFSTEKRSQCLAQLAQFADAFRNINRLVCIDTYTSFHFTERWGTHPAAVQFVEPKVLAALNELHEARRAGLELSDERKRHVFETHFLNEQQYVVGPRINEALAAFDWPLVKELALRPLVRFAYFGPWQCFWFSHFDRREERIERGLQAFDMAATAGWDHVESSLRSYDLLPATFFQSSAIHFAQMRDAILATTV
jgi:hypothetical protein